MPAPNPLELIRVAAARHSLGLIHSWEIPPVADRALGLGVYSDSLAELAAIVNPQMAEVGPLLARAMAELGLPVLTKADAARYLTEHCVRRIACTDEPPLSPLTLLKEVSYAAEQVLPNRLYVGDGLDLGTLIGIYWSYSQPNENYYEPEGRVITNEIERRAILDTLAREECRRWLARHG